VCALLSYSDTTAPNEREWVREIWNAWFDGVFPPTPRAETPVTDAPVGAPPENKDTDAVETSRSDKNENARFVLAVQCSVLYVFTQCILLQTECCLSVYVLRSSLRRLLLSTCGCWHCSCCAWFQTLAVWNSLHDNVRNLSDIE